MVPKANTKRAGAWTSVLKKGLPLKLLVLMVAVWVGARALLWDSPIAYAAPTFAANVQSPERSQQRSSSQPSLPLRQSIAYPVPAAYYSYPPYYGPAKLESAALGLRQVITRVVYYPVYPSEIYPRGGNGIFPQRTQPVFPTSEYARAPALMPRGHGSLARTYPFDDIWSFAGQDARRTGQVSRPASGEGLPSTALAGPDRWMADVFSFYRQGSSALSLPQGRSPIYGASQLSANLQWRARPSSSHDPRIFVRAYQAQVEGGESEIAAGVSGRPFGNAPVRLFGELRATQSPAISELGVGVRTKLRPAVYAATELAPIKLPVGLSLETYGAAGYVAGSPSTYFFDGQAVATRELLRIGKPGAGGSVSVGGGVWGGAQRDAKRLDVGPTLRFDVDIGKMPARVSVDYREQVAGDADPDSGIAATVSTRF